MRDFELTYEIEILMNLQQFQQLYSHATILNNTITVLGLDLGQKVNMLDYHNCD